MQNYKEFFQNETKNNKDKKTISQDYQNLRFCNLRLLNFDEAKKNFQEAEQLFSDKENFIFLNDVNYAKKEYEKTIEQVKKILV